MYESIKSIGVCVGGGGGWAGCGNISGQRPPTSSNGPGGSWGGSNGRLGRLYLSQNLGMRGPWAPLDQPLSTALLFVRRKAENVLFNDALNTFYFTAIWRQTHGREPLSSEKRSPLPPLQGLLFPISRTFYFYAPSYSRGVLAGTRISAMGPQ